MSKTVNVNQSFLDLNRCGRQRNVNTNHFVMNEQSLKAMKTIAGGLFYSIITYNTTELHGRDWELLCSYLKIETDTLHSVSVIPNGFQLSTKTFSMRYTHNSYHLERRKVEFIYNPSPQPTEL
jgi:hypothetical protein